VVGSGTAGIVSSIADLFPGLILCFPAHDIARDYCENGIGMTSRLLNSDALLIYSYVTDVTMIQRGPTYVMSANPGWEFLNKGGCTLSHLV
jgi:hypothetical protein